MNVTLHRTDLRTGEATAIPCAVVGVACDRCHRVAPLAEARRWREGWVCADRAACADRALANIRSTEIPHRG